MATRRSILQVLAAGPLLAGCASQGSDPAAAWRNPGAGETDPRRWALAHAILAPNPHNRQPWLVDLPGEDEIVLYADLQRLLPATDPPNRQITVGCGAFLELLDLAARQRGLRAEIMPWPEGEPQPQLDARPVAHVRLTPDATVAADPLFDRILARHTTRQPFDMAAPPSAQQLATLAAVAPAPLTAGGVLDPALRDRLSEIGARAFGIEMTTTATHMESVNLMRIGAAKIARHRDGIALDGPMIEAMAAVGLISHKALADPDSMASRQGLDMWTKMIAATPAFLWLKGPDNSRATQLAAGRAYARMHLTATGLGLQFHPWSMALQEFPEMAGPYGETQAALGATPDAPLQMLVRVGRAKSDPPAPRRGLEAHIRA
jgi:hypothetical protein